jgi:hypothetical protein
MHSLFLSKVHFVKLFSLWAAQDRPYKHNLIIIFYRQ